MNFDHLLILLPCHSIEDFELRRKDEDAEQLLSAWSALWHPLLLASAKAIPHWLPAASPPQEPSGYLMILPDCCETLLPEGWMTQAEAAGACVLRNLATRNDMVAAALERLSEPVGDSETPPHCNGGGVRGLPASDLDPDLAADFLALGYCHMQVELLTRKLRYTSNLDEASLKTAALAAADAAIQGQLEAARGHLQSAFDRLHEAREYSYSTQARLLDLTLVAQSTLGVALRAELAGGIPRNLLVSGKVIEAMAQREPATLDALRQALAVNTATLIGGEDDELPLPLLGPEAIEFHLRRGLAAYQKHLGQRPKTFGRRRFGLTPALPQILERRGLTDALHFTLDDGRFPTGNQSRTQWEGIDGTTIEAIGCLPLDAGRAESFLRLAEKLGDAMNLDQNSAVLFAHWPGRYCTWYDDLRRIAAYGSVLGKFLSVADYFEQTTLAGLRNRYQADLYRSPYLRQDVSAGRPDPISRWVRYFGRRATLEAGRTLQTLTTLCNATERKAETSSMELEAAIEDSLEVNADVSSTIDEELTELLRKPLVGFDRSIAGDASSPKRGCLVVNPCSFPQQVALHPSSFIPHPSLIDVPAMGFAWIDTAAPPPAAQPERKSWFGKRKPQAPPPLAEENVLRNEFFEVRFDPHTGGIRTISDYRSRDPRLAQQIALRLPRGGESGTDENYSIMAADELVVTSSGPLLGEIQSRGRLMDRQGHRVAGFRQTTRAWRGSRILEIEIELDINRQPGPNPWDSYYAARFAWKDPSATLSRSVNLANVPTELTQFESPHYVDICRGKQHTTLLLGGLAYHRRLGPRKLDTLLAVQGERARSFRLGIAIDAPHPLSAALGFLAPPMILPDQPMPAAASGWLFHLDCRNVLATHWEPLPMKDDDTKENSRGLTAPGAGPETAPGADPETAPVTGFRVRLLETDGRSVRLGLRCFRNVASARQINPGDEPPEELAVEGDRIEVPIGPHQWIEVEGRFAPPLKPLEKCATGSASASMELL
jgi:alpha-mannosidase